MEKGVPKSTLTIHNHEKKSLKEILLENRKIAPHEEKRFFTSSLDDLHDPFLMPDMAEAVAKILKAREKKERVVVFGDYDVDGVSSTAMLVRFFQEIGIEVSYRLPHRVHDGYGLKNYFFDELKEKNVKLVITVDCGTRDIETIHYALSLGIDIIITDHHAVPETIPAGVPVVNPKRTDSHYPFPGLAGAGVAFKLLHAVYAHILSIDESKGEESTEGKRFESDEGNTKMSKVNAFLDFGEPFASFESGNAAMKTQRIYKKLIEYIDFASLGTVADCMSLTDENRIITTLGLKRMRASSSPGLRKFLENKEHVEGNADIIGFQIGPRINASGRMDTPLTALRWLLASEDRCDEFLYEIEDLNIKRQEKVKTFTQSALAAANPDDGILFFLEANLEHGLIGLVAGKLTETYNRPSIVLCEHAGTLVASCRAPEWCNLISLLDETKEFFIRYGGHRQAAGFSISAEKFPAFRSTLQEVFRARYGTENLPHKTLAVECILKPNDITLENVRVIESFRPFGIGNPKPLFLLEYLTLTQVKWIGNESTHIAFSVEEIPGIKFLFWNARAYEADFREGNVVSLLVEIEKNTWQHQERVQCIVRDVVVG